MINGSGDEGKGTHFEVFPQIFEIRGPLMEDKLTEFVTVWNLGILKIVPQEKEQVPEFGTFNDIK